MAKNSAPIQKPAILQPVHWLAIGLVAVAAIGVIYILFNQRPAPPQNANTATAKPVVAVTPQNFTDIIGTVESVADGSMKVGVIITETNGQQTTRHYDVTLAEDTTIDIITIVDTGASMSSLPAGQLRPGDTVQVFNGEQNLYEVSSFTAERGD